jgi:lantibiotic modifying enzyme
MVMQAGTSMFLTEALRLGRELMGSAIRHDSRCTWLGNGLTASNGIWQRTAGVIGADFGSGAAGVGWFLAHLGAAAKEPVLTGLAVEAFRQALAGVDDLIDSKRLGFYDGATGIAWAAIAGGRIAGSAEVEDAGRNAGVRAAGAAHAAAGTNGGPGLWNGDAGLLIGLLGLSTILSEPAFVECAHAPAKRLAESITLWTSAPGRAAVGLANGASGAGLALAAWAARSMDEPSSKAAVEAFGLERPWQSQESGWFGASAHEWAEPLQVARSVCSGAAGIGIARIAGYLVIRRLDLLAEAAAAIDAVRRVPPGPDGPDASICHGAAGEIELCLSAWSALAEPVHIEAARRLGAMMIETAHIRGQYASGLGDIGPAPGVLLGLAGTGLTLLRLHDPGLAPSAAVPPLIS